MFSDLLLNIIFKMCNLFTLKFFIYLKQTNFNVYPGTNFAIVYIEMNKIFKVI